MLTLKSQVYIINVDKGGIVMNVLSLNNILVQQNDAISESIERFLEFKKASNENTYINYKSHISEFFRMTKNKELKELVNADLEMSKKDIKQYQLNLYKVGYKSSTISIRISVIKKLYQSLIEDGFSLDCEIFNVDRVKSHDQERYGSLSLDEVREIIRFIRKSKYLGAEKALLIEMAFDTAIRLDSLLNARKSNLKVQNGLHIIDVIDKGHKRDTKRLTKEVWQRAMTLNDGDRIFLMSKKTVDRMMELIRENFDFGDRIIVFHSFKKACINHTALLTDNNIKAMQRQGNHSNASTTLNNYVDDMRLEDTILIDVNQEFDIDKIYEASHEDLLKAISKLDTQTRRLISLNL